MSSQMRCLIGIALIALLVIPAVAAEEGSDDWIYDHVRSKLASDLDVRGNHLVVTVAEGVVTLEGRVQTDKAKKKAEKLTSKTKGVKKVVNKLTVGFQQ